MPKMFSGQMLFNKNVFDFKLLDRKCSRSFSYAIIKMLSTNKQISHIRNWNKQTQEEVVLRRTRPLSTWVVSMTTIEEPCSHVICQKSEQVLGRGPWHAM